MARILHITGILFVLAAPLAAQSKIFEQTAPLRSGGLLRLDARRGSVRLTGWDRDQVEIRARIEAESSWDTGHARRVVEGTTVDFVTNVRNEITIRGNYEKVPSHDWIFGLARSTPNIHYDIRAPRRISLRLEVDRSNAVINGFEGAMDLEANRSVIDATGLTGPLRIRVERGGDSSFRNLQGSFTIEAERTNLRLDLTRLDASSLIVIDRGNIDLSLARNQGFNLDTSLSRRSSFDSNLALEAKSFRQSNPSGAINGGGPRLTIQADRSRIRLR